MDASTLDLTLYFKKKIVLLELDLASQKFLESSEDSNITRSITPPATLYCSKWCLGTVYEYK